MILQITKNIGKSCMSSTVFSHNGDPQLFPLDSLAGQLFPLDSPGGQLSSPDSPRISSASSGCTESTVSTGSGSGGSIPSTISFTALKKPTTSFTALTQPTGSNHKVAYIWHITIRVWQKLMHALHGNGSTSNNLVGKLQTNGMPQLKEGPTTEEYISFKIDLKGWATTLGIELYITGPEIDLNAEEPIEAADKPAFRTKVAQGMQYVCASIKDPNLRSSMASQATHKNGPSCLKWLTDEILQGVAEQPSIQQIINGMSLQPRQSIISFKAQYCKFTVALDPKPAAQTLCTNYITALSRDTNGFYDDCVSAALSASDCTDFTIFANLLTRLCSNKAARTSEAHEGKICNDALLTEIKALQSQILALQNEAKPGSTIQPSKFICYNCGTDGHPKKDCPEPRVKCTFTFEDGTRCNGWHLEQFCFYKYPEKCPKAMIDAVKERIKRHSKPDDDNEDVANFIKECLSDFSNSDDEEINGGYF